MARKSLRTVRSALAQKLASQPPMDLPFLLLILTLVAFGLIMLGSASWAVGLYRRGDAYAYLRPQLLFAAVGLAALWAASRVDYHIYHRLAWPLLGLSLVLLAVDAARERGLPLRRMVTAQPLPLRWLVYYAAVLSLLVFGIWGPQYDAAAFLYFQF